MKRMHHRQYFIGYRGSDYKEVSREIFLKCLKGITKKEYNELINGRRIRHGDVCFYIKDKYEMVKDEFDTLIERAWGAIRGDLHCYNRICKLVNGIECGIINKCNLYEQTSMMKKRVKSKNALYNWSKIEEWFVSEEWF